MDKIVLITPILQHYRLSFYEKLAERFGENNFFVFHGVKEKEDGRPGYKGKTKFINKGFPETMTKVFRFEVVYDRGMYAEVKKVNPDIIIIQGITGNISYRRIVSWAKRNRKKVIIWTSGWEPGRSRGMLLKLKNLLVTSFFKKGHYFLTYSNYGTSYVKTMGIDSSIIETCYNGIEIDDLISQKAEIVAKSKDVEVQLGLHGNITFLYVGGLIPEKKVDLLIAAFEKLRKKYKNIKLVIIGDGPMRNLVETKVVELNDDNIHYLGRIVDGVDPYFAASDCFVLPGVGGLALNQAMFWGKPCIVSKADGTEDKTSAPQ
ncbi:MAG: glycosyltransferase, partial [Flavobacterium sp.]